MIMLIKKNIMKKYVILLVSLCILIPTLSEAQNLKQTIRGQVFDKQSQVTLPGATIVISNTNPIVGVTADADGNFKLPNVPLGRVSLVINMLGYQPVSLSNLSITAGKELILKIEMEEQVYKVKEVVITANKLKTQPINEMTTLSSRSFSIEETQRFAGARNDVARMATNYAGVNTANDAQNGIVIRGNSPNGLLWKLEGIDIPNPNHFGSMGATSGPVGMLNNNVLSNSDFMTAAFPAEYGNALSGVFDLKMRSGNNEKHEFLGQIGFNGFEFGAEGPISKKNHSSYLINYRYSTLGVVKALGISIGTGAAVPQYQDISFKFNFPSLKYGSISIFGLGGKSGIDFIKNDDDEGNLYNEDNFNIHSKSKSGVVGISHKLIINNSTWTNLTIAATGIGNYNLLDSISTADNSILPYYRSTLVNKNMLLTFTLHKKFNAKNNCLIGFDIRQMKGDFIDSTYLSQYNGFRKGIDFDGNAWLSQAFVEWQHKFTDNIVLNSGFHILEFALNDKWSAEPRLGLKWMFTNKQSFSLAYGLHSKTEALYSYFLLVNAPDGSYSQPNKKLDFTKSHHFAAAYDINFSPTLRLKVETYYQYIFNAIIEKNPSNYSMLNYGAGIFGIPDSLKNGGKGRNYGIDLTFEKFMDKGFYMLFTSSLFRSFYTGSDNIERSTAFDSKYVVNLLAGKEFELQKKKENAKYKKWIVVDGRVCSAGGLRYTPVDVEKSAYYKQTFYNEDLAFTKKFSNYFRADIRFAYRYDGKRMSQEFAFDIQNITGHKNPLMMKYNQTSQKEEPIYQLGVYPMMQYRVVF